ncbi:MAG: response regulator [Chloroflexi bacterium]|nr:response regulator [Chloroflexota bacterium]
MNQTSHNFRAELRVPLNQVVAAFGAIAGGVLIAVAPVSDLHRAVTASLYAALLASLAIVTHYLNKWNPQASRWFAVLSAMSVVHLARLWLGVPGALALVALPPLLAGALIGVRAATAVAVVETVVTLWAWNKAGAIEPAGTIAGALLSIWGAVAIMVGSYAATYRVSDWAWEYYQQALRMIQEAQQRHVQLAQAIEDLAAANLQLVRLNNLTQGLRQAAEDARIAKEQFVANVSHELRTPLNMIIGFSEMILKTPQTYGRLPRRLLADLAVIQRNAEHLADLIDDVLDLSQLETDQMALIKEQAQFADIVEMAALAVRPLYQSKGLSLDIDIAPNLPPVFCDPTRIREVLLNLLSNAGRFTEKGGVYLCAWQEQNDLVASVTDTGPGIAAHNVRNLFQPFYQVDSSIRRRYGGTGLGLAISKRFVELHGGNVWVESEEGVGTTFTFRIPLTPPVSPESTSPFARGMTPGWEFLQRTRPYVGPKLSAPPRLVLVEPDGLLKRLMARYLDGVELVTATSVKEAAAQLAHTPAQALLVTNSAPQGDLTNLDGMKQLPTGIPVITCRIPDANRASASTKTEWLVKPVARETLLATLEKLEVMTGTILIVDDDPDALHLFGRMLDSSERGYRTLLATDGQQALEILEECRPDAILLDLVMPRVDGFQVLERRSQDSALREIPVAIISAQDPAGQPIVSSGLAVAQREGLSARKLLQCITALVNILSAGERGDGPILRETVPDELACG